MKTRVFPSNSSPARLDSKKRKSRRTRKFKKYRGGSPPPLENTFQWPPMKGCVKEFTQIVFEKDEIFDRFGSIRGTNVSPMYETAKRIANEIGLNEEQPYTYAYTQRALPYVGINNSGLQNNKIRKLLYNKSYKNKSQSDYHQYKVLKADFVKGGACEVAPAFKTSGGGIQVKLDKNIDTLIKEGAIEEINIPITPSYFPSNLNKKLTIQSL